MRSPANQRRQLCVVGMSAVFLAFLHSIAFPTEPVCLEWNESNRAAAYVVISPDGKWISARSVEKLILWDFATKEKVATFTKPREERFDTAVFSPDSQHLVYLDGAGRVCLLDGSSGWADAQEREILGPPTDSSGREMNSHSAGAGEDIAISPDGTLLAIHRRLNTIEVVELDTGKSVGALGLSGYANTLQFADQGNVLVVGCSGNVRRGHFVEFWDMKTLEAQEPLRVKPSRTVGKLSGLGTVLSPTEDVLAVELSGPSIINELRLYELPSRRWVTLATDPRLMCWPSFSPDGRLLAVGTQIGPGCPAVVLVWDLQARKWLRFECPPHIAQQNTAFWNTKFSPDGRYLAAGLNHPEVAVCIWDLEAEEETSESD